MEVRRQELEKQRAQLALEVEEGRGGEEKLEKTEAALSRLDRDSERKALAAKAKAERDKEERVRRKAEVIRQMEGMLVKLEAELEKKLKALKSKPDPERKDVLPVYVLARQAYGLSHDLHSVTGLLKHSRRWDIRNRLGGDLSELIRDYFIANIPKPKVETPWRELYEIARESA